MHAMIVFGRFLLLKHCDMERKANDNGDAFAKRNAGCIVTLWDYGILKFF